MPAPVTCAGSPRIPNVDPEQERVGDAGRPVDGTGGEEHEEAWITQEVEELARPGPVGMGGRGPGQASGSQGIADRAGGDDDGYDLVAGTVAAEGQHKAEDQRQGEEANRPEHPQPGIGGAGVGAAVLEAHRVEQRDESTIAEGQAEHHGPHRERGCGEGQEEGGECGPGGDPAQHLHRVPAPVGQMGPAHGHEGSKERGEHLDGANLGPAEAPAAQVGGEVGERGAGGGEVEEVDRPQTPGAATGLCPKAEAVPVEPGERHRRRASRQGAK